MPRSDDSWYACLGQQGHLWVYWLYPLDLCYALRVYYLSSSFFRDSHLRCSRMPVMRWTVSISPLSGQCRVCLHRDVYFPQPPNTIISQQFWGQCGDNKCQPY